MNTELRPISYNEIDELVGWWPDGAAILDFARPADPLFIALLGPVLLGFVGFLPRSTLSDTAYVWVHTTPEASQHKIAVARLARLWIMIFHTRYPTLVGHCFEDRSRRWLASLGATFGPDNTFTIKAPPNG